MIVITGGNKHLRAIAESTILYIPFEVFDLGP